MKVIVATVEKGLIKLPQHLTLPEGATVRIMWEDEIMEEAGGSPFDREALTDEDIHHDLQWATGDRFPSP